MGWPVRAWKALMTLVGFDLDLDFEDYSLSAT
jgi:hypothetical protein